ncbi:MULTISPECIES: spermidine/putrescine ABC transporter permease PotB [unclassified Hahella]|uniref:spermidine/putrescine ABC transporter permease PotB n=1 Tax=unclassified Hahella TaxID=2624107 RepID=UPI000FDEE7FF|nr:MULTISPECIES: spermidine/putrescine ABC transporter permease PotB [unclassified Hahella]AZZ93421.1 spermidine/putrescine ABC transporter permease PotB [Hahella sp. KA22]MBU6954369.1 spermidine/putrescine ABC transporter permease PotB [Hahella sp. HN01]MDG9671888.1 spermidine/putrescine ABC transporter permease PotB [Hahella sp. CR1]QAY56796.1 spermidine/putrescine ABC transporter permease PotB [Hahella sp. KA22]
MSQSPFRRFIIILTLAWLALFVLAPHFLVVLTSVMTPDSEHLAVWPMTLDAYARIWEPLYADVFWQSLALSAKATLICLLLGYPFAYIVAKMSPAWRAFMMFLMIIPFWTNSLIRTYAIKLLLGNKGLFNWVLEAIGVIDAPIQMIYTEFAVVFGLTYILLPFMALPLISSFDKLDKDLIEAGHDLGAGFWQRFYHIVLPLTMPGVVAGCLIVFLPAMGMFYVADLLGGAKNLLLGNIIKNQFLVVRDWPFGSAFSVTLIVIMGMMLWLYYAANKKVQRMGGLDDQNL